MDKFFKLKESGTTVSREIMAGVTTFFAMSYILFLVIAFVLAIQFKLLPQSGGSSVFTRKERYAKRCMRELQHEETL